VSAVDSVVARTKRPLASCSKGVCEISRKKQRRQRDVENKEVEPAELALGQRKQPSAHEAEQDQPEKGQSEIENIDHGKSPRSAAWYRHTARWSIREQIGPSTKAPLGETPRLG
jgi:hypothetical protein